MIKKLLAGLSVGVILITGAVETAYAGFGTEIGVYFPAGGGSSGSSGSSVGYAGFTVDKVAQELTVEEKHGGLVMELCITNEGDTPYTIEHRDGQIYEFVILDKRGKVLWKWSEGMAFTQALTSSTVGAKDSVVYKAEIKCSDYKKNTRQCGCCYRVSEGYAVHNFCQYPRTNTGKRRIFDTWSNTYRYGEWALVR